MSEFRIPVLQKSKSFRRDSLGDEEEDEVDQTVRNR